MALPVVSGVLPGPVHLLQGGAPWWAELCSCPGTHASILEDLRPGLVLLAINDIPLIFGSSLTHLAVGLFSPSTHWIHLNPDQTFYLVEKAPAETTLLDLLHILKVSAAMKSGAERKKSASEARVRCVRGSPVSVSCWSGQMHESWKIGTNIKYHRKHFNLRIKVDKSWGVKRLGTFPLRIIARSTAGWTDIVFETSVTALLLPKQTVRSIVLWSTAGKTGRARFLPVSNYLKR